MAKGGSSSQSKTKYLSTSEAAKQLNVSKGTIRDLCSRGQLPGAYQKREKGPWLIPIEAVTSLISNTSKSSIWWKRFRIGLLITLLGLMFTLISALADLGGARQQLYEWGIFRHFPAAANDEILILIATFHHTEGVPDTDIHNEIRRAIQETVAALGLSNIRVEVEPTTHLTADDRTRAEKLGNRYKASMIIWGADTGIRTTVNFLNLKEPDFVNADVRISETERVQLVRPSAYASFIITDLSKQLTFLSLFAVGRVYYLKGEFADATKTLETAIDSLPPGSQPEWLISAYTGLGWIYQVALADYEKSFDNYNNVIILDPNDFAAYNNRGTARILLGNDLDGAITDYDQAIKLNPDFAVAYTNRGSTRAQQGDLEGAIADLNNAIALDPENVMAHYNRGVARLRQGDLEKAIADLNKVIALNPDSYWAYSNRGIARRGQGDFVGAVSDFDQAITLNTNYADAYSNRGGTRAEQGDLKGAIADLNKAIALSPNNTEIYYNRAIVRGLLEDPEGAIADLEQAIILNPDKANVYFSNSPAFAISYYNRGNHRFARGDLKGAIADYDQAIRINPNYVEAYNNRGNARAKQGDLKGAITDLNKVIALRPDKVNAYFNRGNHRLALGDLEEAIADYDQAIALKPDYAEAYNNRGAARIEQGDLEGAIADFEKVLKLTDDPSLRTFAEMNLISLRAK